MPTSVSVCVRVLCDVSTGVVLTPCFLYALWPPVVTHTPEGPAAAAARLQEMGPLSTDEKLMIGAVSLAVGLWVSAGGLVCAAIWFVTAYRV